MGYAVTPQRAPSHAMTQTTLPAHTAPLYPTGAELSQLLGACLDHLNDSLVITEAEPVSALGRRIVWANDVFYKQTGYRPDEMLGHSPRLLHGPLTDRATLDKVHTALRAWQPIRVELCNYRKDGTTFWNELQLAPVANDQGWFTHWVSVQRDVTERKHAEEALRRNEEKYRQLIDNSHDIIFTLNAKGIITYASPAWTQLLGYPMSQVTGQPYAPFVHPDDVQVCQAAVMQLFESGRSLTDIEYRVRHSDGRWRWHSTNAVPLREGGQQVVAIEGIAKDVTDHKRLEDQVRQLAFYDTLTGLPNRRMLGERLNQALATSQRSGRYGALMFMDLDNFKPLNDTHGHDAGDQLLVEVARRLTLCLRQVDTVARFGGDEFVAIVSELDTDPGVSAQAAAAVAEKIRASLAQPYLLSLTQGGQPTPTLEHHCSVSMGVVMFINHDSTPSDLMKQADTAMYHAKDAGRNQFLLVKTASSAYSESSDSY